MRSTLYLLILLCLGCETVIEVSPPDYDSEPVVTSFFSPDSIWSVRVHRSLSAATKRDVTQEYISDASVMIMNGSTTVDILSYQGEGRYVSSTEQVATDGIQYTLRIDFPDKPSVQAVSVAPSPVVVTDYSIKALPPSLLPPYVDPVDFGNKYQIKVVFSDMPGRDFYRIAVYRRLVRSRRVNGVRVPYSIDEAISIDEGAPGWSCGYFPDEAVDVDPINIGGGGVVSCKEFVTTDRLFDGKSYSWIGTTSFTLSGQSGRKELRLVISSLSEEYYRYRETVERNVLHDQLTQEPTPVYSNVSEGLGVFAGYTNTNLILPFPSED